VAARALIAFRIREHTQRVTPSVWPHLGVPACALITFRANKTPLRAHHPQLSLFFRHFNVFA
jgi:hypothetical protein